MELALAFWTDWRDHSSLQINSKLEFVAAQIELDFYEM